MENSDIPIEFKQMQNKYFTEIQNINNSKCDNCELNKIRKKYLDILKKTI